MKAVVYHDAGDIRLEDVPEPKIQDPNDAIVRIIGSAICGTDLHMVRGTMPGMEPGTILDHEAVGIVEELGSNVCNFAVGDRVVVASTIACGCCSYCRAGYFSQCDNANPNGPQAGTSFFGGPRMGGPVNGLQAELARIPFASVGVVKIPDSVSDEQALMLSGIFPTGYFGADLARIHPGQHSAGSHEKRTDDGELPHRPAAEDSDRMAGVDEDCLPRGGQARADHHAGATHRFRD